MTVYYQAHAQIHPSFFAYTHLYTYPSLPNTNSRTAEITGQTCYGTQRAVWQIRNLRTSSAVCVDLEEGSFFRLIVSTVFFQTTQHPLSCFVPQQTLRTRKHSRLGRSLGRLDLHHTTVGHYMTRVWITALVKLIDWLCFYVTFMGSKDLLSNYVSTCSKLYINIGLVHI